MIDLKTISDNCTCLSLAIFKQSHIVFIRFRWLLIFVSSVAAVRKRFHITAIAAWCPAGVCRWPQDWPTWHWQSCTGLCISSAMRRYYFVSVLWLSYHWSPNFQPVQCCLWVKGLCPLCKAWHCTAQIQGQSVPSRWPNFHCLGAWALCQLEDCRKCLSYQP